MAERVGFEPTSPVSPGYSLSRRALSTAQTPLRGLSIYLKRSARALGNRRARTSSYPYERSSARQKTIEGGSAFLRQNPAAHLDTMIERGMVEDPEAGACGAALGIVASVYHAENARLDDCAGTHGAGLNRHVKCGSEDAMISDGPCRRAQRDDFRVRCRVARGDRAIAGAAPGCVPRAQPLRRRAPRRCSAAARASASARRM